MQILLSVAAVLLGYVIGSFPSGLVIVKLKTGQDLRDVESGRTGGTNAMRAAGFWAGLATAFSDIFKGALAVWLAQLISPEGHLVHALAGVAAILGHNHSIFLPEWDENGKFVRLRGGAGGAPSVGGAMGLWPLSILFVLPLGVLVFFTLGIASVTTMAVAVMATILFAVRASMGLSPWADVIYGVAVTFLLVWALRPNIKKLMEGRERVVKYSLYGKIREKRGAQNGQG
jgi:glycerol-3-phosphate acyltransferase PlsY